VSLNVSAEPFSALWWQVPVLGGIVALIAVLFCLVVLLVTINRRKRNESSGCQDSHSCHTLNESCNQREDDKGDELTQYITTGWKTRRIFPNFMFTSCGSMEFQSFYSVSIGDFCSIETRICEWKNLISGSFRKNEDVDVQKYSSIFRLRNCIIYFTILIYFDKCIPITSIDASTEVLLSSTPTVRKSILKNPSNKSSTTLLESSPVLTTLKHDTVIVSIFPCRPDFMIISLNFSADLLFFFLISHCHQFSIWTEFSRA